MPHTGHFDCISKSLFFFSMLYHFQNVRYHFAGPLHQHGVACMDVQALDFIQVAQSADFTTVTPAIFTGSKMATGVSVPVRPTFTVIAFTTVVSWCAGYL